MFEYTTRLEINVLQGQTVAVETNGLATFMVKNKIPAIVAAPDFLEIVLMERASFGGQYKVICAVDFDSGRRYALEKFRPLPQTIFKADGFDILLTPNRTDKESLNEMRALSEFIRSLNPLMEIRWAFGFRTRTYESMAGFLPYLKKCPANFLRTDISLQSPLVSLKKHQADILLLKECVGTPIKVSGNIDFEIMKELREGVQRFDVSVAQAKKIVKAIQTEQASPELSKPEKVIGSTK